MRRHDVLARLRRGAHQLSNYRPPCPGHPPSSPHGRAAKSTSIEKASALRVRRSPHRPAPAQACSTATKQISASSSTDVRMMSSAAPGTCADTSPLERHLANRPRLASGVQPRQMTVTLDRERRSQVRDFRADHPILAQLTSGGAPDDRMLLNVTAGFQSERRTAIVSRLNSTAARGGRCSVRWLVHGSSMQ